MLILLLLHYYVLATKQSETSCFLLNAIGRSIPKWLGGLLGVLSDVGVL